VKRNKGHLADTNSVLQMSLTSRMDTLEPLNERELASKGLCFYNVMAALVYALCQQKEHWFEQALKDKRGFIIKRMGEDGACLFRSVGE